MPVYDYECDSCGPFTFMRPMAQCDRPARCPQCGGKAPRAFLNVPYVAMAAEKRGSNGLPATGGQHAGGCGCCAPPPVERAGKRSRTRSSTLSG
jgi:putative FmdB family regulatory protein